MKRTALVTNSLLLNSAFRRRFMSSRRQRRFRVAREQIGGILEDGHAACPP
jgi:hypothetical protein